MKTTQRLIAAAISALVAGTGMAVAQSGTGSGGAGGPGGASMGGAASGGAVHRETTGQASPQGGAAQPGGSGAQSPGAREGAGPPPGAAEQRSGSGSTEQRGRTGTQDRTRTGQDQRGGTTEQRTGSATSTTGTSVNLTTEQRTRIHQTIIKESNAPRVANVDFSLSVGTTVPRSVRLARVPSTVIKIYPAWRAYEYFMVGDQIVIVDPGTMHIVAVIAA